MSNATIDLVSAGKLAARLQRDPQAILAAAQRAGVRPRFTFNGVAMFDSRDIPEIRRRLLARRKGAQ